MKELDKTELVEGIDQVIHTSKLADLAWRYIDSGDEGDIDEIVKELAQKLADSLTVDEEKINNKIYPILRNVTDMGRSVYCNKQETLWLANEIYLFTPLEVGGE